MEDTQPRSAWPRHLDRSGRGIDPHALARMFQAV